MARYRWIAINKVGQRCEGLSVAHNKPHLRQQLLQQQLTPLRLIRQFSGPSHQTRRAQRLAWSKQLLSLLKAGYSLKRALIHMQPHWLIDTPLGRITHTIIQQLDAGERFAVILGKHPQHFPRLYLTLIQVGEHTGQLIPLLEQLIHYDQDRLTYQHQLTRCLFYPCFILVVSLIVMMALFITVVPEFAALFQSVGHSHARLPLLTRWVLALSNHLRHDWLYMIFTLLGCLVICRHHRCRAWLTHHLSRALIYFPGVRRYRCISQHSHWAQLVHTTLVSGLPLMDALRFAQPSLTVSPDQTQADHVIRAIESGATLTQALQQFPWLPRNDREFLAIAESSSELNPAFKQLAMQKRESLERYLTRLNQLAEPLIMLLLAGLVGSLMIALYLPIHQLGQRMI